MPRTPDYEKYRKILSLIDKKSHREIQEELKVSPNTIQKAIEWNLGDNGDNKDNNNGDNDNNNNSQESKNEIKPLKIPSKAEKTNINIKESIQEENSNEDLKIEPEIIIQQPKTINQHFEEVIEFCGNKKLKTYARIKRILVKNGKNPDYQSNILRDYSEILIEMRKLN